VKALSPTVNEVVVARVQTLLDRLKLHVNDASVCATDDGACVQWSARRIYCEIFNPGELNDFLVNLFSGLDSRVENRLQTSSMDELCSFLQAAFKARPSPQIVK
jgi:hypothetical protein